MSKKNDEEFDNSTKLYKKGKRKSIMVKNESIEEDSTKIDLKSKRKSVLIKKDSFEEDLSKIDVQPIKKPILKNKASNEIILPKNETKSKRKTIQFRNDIIKEDSEKVEMKSKRKSVLKKTGINTEEEEKGKEKEIEGLNIKSKRKSMMDKKILFQLEENNINIDNHKNRPLITGTSKRRSVYTNQNSDLRLKTDDVHNKIGNRRKSAMIRHAVEITNFITLKSQLISISQIVVQQESDIIEAIIKCCNMPNNYHIYGREQNGELMYLYKLREFSGCAMRFFCPINCRGFTIKMKLVQSYENKYDNNFKNSIMTIKKDFKIPFLCLFRPDLKVNLEKEETFLGMVEKNFTLFDPCFTIYNEKDQEVKYIETDCCQCGFFCRNFSVGKTEDVHFFIYNNSSEKSKPIGEICKKTESLFSISDSYSIIFPVSIPPEEKILLSLVAVLIDYHYFENNNNGK